MKITIVSAYTWYNKGDAAILMGTITELTEFYKDVDFNILTFTPDVDKQKYKQLFDNIDYVGSNIFNPYPVKKTKTAKSIAIVKMGLQFIYLKILTLFAPKAFRKANNISQCMNSDLIVICGGGFLGGNKYNSLIHLAQISLLSTLNIPMVLWGTSIEPPTKAILKKITERVLNKIDLILPREQITQKYLLSFYKGEIVPTPDMAFKLGEKNNKQILKTFDEIKKTIGVSNLIGITMRDWFFPKSLNPVEDYVNYENSIISLIDGTVDTGFIFIPQVIMPGDDDRIFAKKVRQKLKNKEKFIILKDDYSPYELKQLIRCCDQFLGTRMHSNIFSLTVGKAPVAIAYEKKTNGIMEKVGLSDYVVDIEDVTENILRKKLLLNLEKFADLNSVISSKVIDFQEEIRTATQKVIDKLSEDR